MVAALLTAVLSLPVACVGDPGVSCRCDCLAFAVQFGRAWAPEVADCLLGPLQASQPHSEFPSHAANSTTSVVRPELLCTQLWVALREGPEERAA